MLTKQQIEGRIMLTIKIANIAIGLDNRYEFIEKFAADYVTDEAAEFTVCATDEDIEAERAIAEMDYPVDYLESIVLYRKIAEHLPEYDALVFHGAVLETEGEAYAITAHSGVGKTTHVRLWLSEFGDSVRILNGDKPILRMIDGVIYACGTPWRGKEHYGVNSMAPLKGIAFLSRGSENLARRISPSEVTMRFMNQIYLGKKNALMISRTMQIADRILKNIPLFELECNMDAEAARVAYAAFKNAK